MKKTIFFHSDEVADMDIEFHERYGLKAAAAFLTCADAQLREYFEKQTGITISKAVSFSPVDANHQYQKGDVSQYERILFANHHWNRVTIKWKSKSGRVYQLDDTDVDCADIVFWMDGLDIPKLYQQIYPKQPLPFKLKDLTYDLVVKRINIDETFELSLNGTVAPAIIIERVDNFIDGYNEVSEARDREFGVVHNWKREEVGRDKILYELDLGSTGAHFLKELLLFLSKMAAFSRVELS